MKQCINKRHNQFMQILDLVPGINPFLFNGSVEWTLTLA